MADTLRARTSFSYDHKGVPVWVREGELRSASHPDVKGREDLFEAVEVASTRESTRGSHTPEMATANPGQARSLSRP